MPGTMIGRGNMLYDFVIGPSLTPSAVAATTSAEQSFTVAGLQTNDMVDISNFNGAQTAGVVIANARVSAANTLGITFGNVGTTSVTPASGQYLINIVRLEVSALNQLPTTAI